MMLDDEYSTCADTNVTLRIIGPSSPEISQYITLPPTQTHEFAGKSIWSIWLLESRHHVSSRDTRRHLNWIVNNVSSDAVRSLSLAGATIAILCYWRSKTGHGGPTISAEQLRPLGDMGVDVIFDFYV